MATIKQKKAFNRVVENGGNVSRAMMEVGYSPATAKTPQKLTTSKSWEELMKTYLNDDELGKRHKELLNSTRIDHMVFPLGPKGEDDSNLSGARSSNEGGGHDVEPEAAMPEEHKERTSLTDKEIIGMLAEVNCKVRRIVHGETARHVYFWAADNKARKDALDMAYKLKGRYPREGSTVAVQVNINEDREQFM